MREKKKRTAGSILSALSILLFALPLGVFLWLFGLAGKMCGALRVLHHERMDCLDWLDKKFVVAPHPSWIDPFLVAFVLAWHYVRHPLKHAPLIVADRFNFYDCWWFWPFRSVMVPIDRDSDRKKAFSLLRIREAVECGRPIIIFPEGGRTFKGENGKFLYGKKGAKSRIRFLQEGIGFLVAKTGATVIPIGIKGSDEAFPNSKERLFTKFVPWKRITISVGEPISFPSDTPRGQITQEIAFQILVLIDEASD